MGMMPLITLDLEGVLVPEIWQAVAAKTKIEALERTTRDEPDYDKLMRYRLAILEQHQIGYSQIAEVLRTIHPLEGARAFLDDLRRDYPVLILSDTFAQFARALLPLLGMPTILCHTLIIDNNRINGYRLRQTNQKEHAVKALQSLNYRVIAAGDSFNDIAMLQAADAGFLFHAPPSIRAQFPQFSAWEHYDDLRQAIDRATQEA